MQNAETQMLAAPQLLGSKMAQPLSSSSASSVIASLQFQQVEAAGLVEVVEPTLKLYEKAILKDVDPHTRRYVVRYLGNGTEATVEASRVRMPPRDLSASQRNAFQPKEGDVVEVAFAAEGGHQSWWEGEVEKEKGGFYYIVFPNESTTRPTQIVEKDRLRPPHGHVPARL